MFRGKGNIISRTSSMVSSPPPKQQQQPQHARNNNNGVFDDLMPPALEPASPSSPTGLFSPSQQAVAGSEQVLHSIFSPTILLKEEQQSKQRHRQRHHPTPSSKKVATDDSSTTPPQSNRNHQQQPTSAAASIPRSVHLKTKQQSHDLLSPLEIFYSPEQPSSSLGWRLQDGGDDKENPPLFSPLSAITLSDASISSWKSYSLEHITSCQSATELQQIITQLEQETATTVPCPSLVRAARERLQSIISAAKSAARTTTTTTMKQQAPPPPPPPPRLEPVDEEKNKSDDDDDDSNDIEKGQATKDSPNNSDCHLKAHASSSAKVVTPPQVVLCSNSNRTTTNTTPSPSAQTATSSLVYSIEDDDDDDDDVMGAASTNNHDNDSNSKQATVSRSLNTRSSHQQQQQQQQEQLLKTQVARLTDTIIELDQRHAQEQERFEKRLHDLQAAEGRAKDKIQALQCDLATSQASNQELLESLEAMQQDVTTLRLQYQAEQSAREEQVHKHEQVEAQLRDHIQQLVQQVHEEQQKRAAAAAKVTTNADNIEMQRKHAQLNVELRSIKYTLEAVRKERNAMIRAMLDSTGQNVHDIKQLTRHDRRLLIADFAKTSAAAKGAFDAMSKTLSLTELERQQAVDCRRKMEGQVKDMVQANARLEANNSRLTQQIQKLSDDLVASRARVDELLQSAQAQQQQECQQREVQYQRTIRSLKKQLCSQPSMVPARDYNSAVKEANRLTKTVGHLEQELQHQEEYYYQRMQQREQEQQKEKKRMPPAARKPQLSRVDSDASNGSSKENRQPLLHAVQGRRHGVVLDPDTTNLAENVAPTNKNKCNQQNSIKKSPPPPLPTSNTTTTQQQSAKSRRRHQVVRNAGGRKGLQEQLQRARTPSLAATATSGGALSK